MASEIKSIKSIFYQKSGIEFSKILFKKNNQFKTQIPDKLKKEFSLISKKWGEKDKTNSFKNQDSLCVSKFHVKDKKIFLEFCEDKYITRQSISETISSLPAIDQDFLLSEIINGNLMLPISYKLNLGIISKDNHLILVKRSQKVSTNKSKIDFGISKGVLPQDFNGKSFQPIVTAIRAIKEELNLILDPKEIVKKEAFTLNDFYLNREIFSLNFFGIIDLRKLDLDLSAEKILDLSNGAKNSWEISEIFSLEMNKKVLIKYLKENYNKITNYSLYNLTKITENLK